MGLAFCPSLVGQIKNLVGSHADLSEEDRPHSWDVRMVCQNDILLYSPCYCRYPVDTVKIGCFNSSRTPSLLTEGANQIRLLGIQSCVPTCTTMCNYINMRTNLAISTRCSGLSSGCMTTCTYPRLCSHSALAKCLALWKCGWCW